ncbi:MAG TPA: glycoside hydrolase family 25 protein, partial [Candidatus Limnocylindrales bacterium]|nr:glycoside hydrolase family 25 protein [Candidatus Limnocylindrales bacterium]
MTIARRFAAPIALALLLVTLIPLGVGLADAATARLAANCAVNVRARPTTLSTKRTVVATNTLVTVTGTVKGGAYMTTCHKAVSGSSWYAISAIGSRSVSSLFGVKVVYAASALFRSTTTTAGPAAGVAYGPTYGPSYGIDVSRWQGTIDFKKVRAAGKRFVIAKATEGRLYTDDAYARNRAGAIAAGLTFTAYHFAHPDGSRGDASLEADHFVAIAGLRHGMLIPALDLENGQTLGTVGLQTWVKTWLNRVYTRLGVKAMIYT